jgi:CHASE3 domain sensor protein
MATMLQWLGMRTYSWNAIGIIVAAIVWSALVAFAGVQIAQFTEAISKVDRARSLAIATRNVLISCLDAETGERGFLLARDSRFLDSYRAGSRAAPYRANELRDLAAGTDQAPLAANITSLVQQKLDELETTISLRDRGAVIAEVRHHLDVGKNLMDQIRVKLDEIQLWANASYQVNQPRATRSAQWAFVAVILSLVLGLTVSFWQSARKHWLKHGRASRHSAAGPMGKE